MTRRPTSDEWAEIARQFDTLIDIPVASRDARLAKLRADPFVIEQLRSLLAATDSGSPLDLAAQLVSEGDPVDYASLSPGTTVGPFCIERLIGRGGMGEVYLATRQNVSFVQRVALKLLRPEAVARAALFESERKMLAALDHPGITRLIDGGIAPDGRPYMALEYVDGQALATWCTATDADLATRLALFVELCAAVEHAHARLTLHLDIKPANILVDGEGRVRLLDFGVARIVELTSVDRTMTQALLTPDYAAPEQFGHGRPTVATDVYALGAVLFELLAGRGPWQFDDAPLPTVLRRLLHDDPPYPSQVTSERGLPARRLHGDLDAIVMKAMRRDPAERYASVAALSADVGRYLAIKPVAARAGSMWYQTRRFLRRNRWAATAAAAAIGLMLAGVGGIVLQSRETLHERNLALAEAARVEAVNEAMVLMFREAGEARQSDTITARALVDGTARKLVETLDPAAPKSAAVIGALSDLYVLVGDIPGSQALLEAATAKRIGADDPVASAELQQKRAINLGATREFAKARQLLAAADRVWSTEPERFLRQRVEAAGSKAYMLRLEGKRQEGIDLLLAGMSDAERAYAGSPGDLATRYANLALHLVESNRVAEAKALIARAEASNARTEQTQTQAGLSLMQANAGILARDGDVAGAETVARKMVAIRRARSGRSFGLAVDLLQQGRLLTQLGRPADALVALDEAQPMALEFFGPNTPPTLMIGQSRADALALLGRIDEAERALNAVMPGLNASGPDSLMAGIGLRSRALIALKRGELDAADAALTQADRVFRKVGPAAVLYARATRPLRAEIAKARGT